MESFTLSLAFIVRFKATGKWPVARCAFLFLLCHEYGHMTSCNQGPLLREEEKGLWEQGWYIQFVNNKLSL